MEKNRTILSANLIFKEEIANTVSHGLGALLMLCLLPISAIYAYENYSVSTVIGICIFVTSLFLMFLTSTFYHSMTHGSKQKDVLKVMDHSMIFVAIAGSYTPVALAVIGGIAGYVIISIQWVLTIIGILYKTIAKKSKDIVSIGLYLGMGWTAIFILPRLINSASPTLFVLILLGGICYTLGIIFYSKKKPYSHTIWHIFILVAALCHYVGIVFFIK